MNSKCILFLFALLPIYIVYNTSVAALNFRMRQAISPIDCQHVYIYCSTLICRIVSGYFFTNVMEVQLVENSFVACNGLWSLSGDGDV